jgi:hypothetical protein
VSRAELIAERVAAFKAAADRSSLAALAAAGNVIAAEILARPPVRGGK